MIGINIDADTAALAASVGGGLLAVARTVGYYGARIVSGITGFSNGINRLAEKVVELSDRVETLERTVGEKLHTPVPVVAVPDRRRVPREGKEL